MLSKEAYTLLSVESSAGPASCAILRVENGKYRILAQSFVNTGLTHSQTLLPLINHTIADAGLTVADIDVLAVAVGPGSFTGVRIGVSAVKGLAFPKNLPCVPVSTLAGMAQRLEGIPFNGRIVTAMDARCHQIYTALFSLENGIVTRLTPDEALPMDEMKDRLLKQDGSILLVGDGAQLCYEQWQKDVPDLWLAPSVLRYQHAVGIAIAAVQQNIAVTAEELVPAYLRLPQAERELRSRQQNK